jgi:hypothetical protein
VNYSQTQIANLMLGRIGARGTITSVYENSINAVRVLAIWDAVFQEVLSERDWKFAKIRAVLQQAPYASFSGFICGSTGQSTPGNILIVTAITSGTILVGQSVGGCNVMPGTTVTVSNVPQIITFPGGGVVYPAGNGGVGAYVVSQSQNVSGNMQAGVWPLYAYKYAWAMPSDFLRFVRPHQRPPDRNWTWMWGPEGAGFYRREDPPFWPGGEPYIVETLPIDGNKYALTNYDGCRGPAKINYIRLITDLTQLMPGFVNCLVSRGAMELAIPVTEDKQKREDMKTEYKESLNSAEAQNETMDFEHDEAGSDSWVRAGRCVNDIRGGVGG